MSLKNPMTQTCVIAEDDAINNTISQPVANPRSQNAEFHRLNLEAQDHGTEYSSGSSYVRTGLQLIATLLALFVRTT